MSLVKVKGSVLENSVDSLADLPVYAKAGETINVNHFYADVEGGGGIFVWADEAKSTHNGGTIIDPSHPSDPGAAGWWTANGSGNGVWKRQYDGAVNVKWFGANGNGTDDDTSAVQKALDIDINNITIYIPKGVYLVSDLINSGKNLFGDGTASILQATPGATFIMSLTIITGVWRYTKIEDLSIVGNTTCDGLVFKELSNGADGRYILHELMIYNCLKGIHQTNGNIGNRYSNLIIYNCDYGIYSRSGVSSAMHTGAQIIEGCYITVTTKAAVAIIHTDTPYFGQYVFKNNIIEYNNGIGILIKDTDSTIGGVVLDNTWMENPLAYTAGTVDIDGTLYEKANYVFDNVKQCKVTNCRFDCFRVYDTSDILLDTCVIDSFGPGYVSEVEDNSTVVSINQISDIRFADTNIFTRSILPVGTKIKHTYDNPHFHGMLHSSKVHLPSNTTISKAFNNPSPMSLANTSVISTQVREGGLYEYASQFTIPAATTEIIVNVPLVMGNWYVISCEYRTTGTVKFSGDTTTGIIGLQSNVVSGFTNYKAVVYAYDNRTITPAFVGGDSGGIAVIREIQAVRFDTEQDAVSYLNSGAFSEPSRAGVLSSGTDWVETGINVNVDNKHSVLFLSSSLQTGAGDSTSASYSMIRFGYSGDNATLVPIVSNGTGAVEIQVVNSLLQVRWNTPGTASYNWWFAGDIL